MTNIYMLLLMSVSGTIMYLLSSIFGKKTRHHIWHYAMLITSLIMLLVPIQKIFEIPRLFEVTVPKTLNISNINTAQSAVHSSVSEADIITAVWVIGIVVFAARIICKYIKTSLTLRQITEECYNSKILDIYFNVCKKLPIRKNIILRSSKYLNSPLLFGIFRPTIIIPEKAFSELEVEMILTHELIHYKHRDLWVALFASIAQCVHWFNPAVYFIGKSISEVCELFCDETVVKRLDPADKKAYGNLILSVIERELNSRLAYTTSMASAKGSIQKRLRKIVEFKMPTKASTIAGIMAVCAFSVSSLTAFGFEIAAEVIPEEVKQIIPIVIPTATPPVETPAVPPTEAPYNSSTSVPLVKTSYERSYDEVSETSYEQIQEISYEYDAGAISDGDDEGTIANGDDEGTIANGDDEGAVADMINPPTGITSESEANNIVPLAEDENYISLSFPSADDNEVYFVSIYDIETGYVTPESGVPVTQDKFTVKGLTGGHNYSVSVSSIFGEDIVDGDIKTGFQR